MISINRSTLEKKKRKKERKGGKKEREKNKSANEADCLRMMANAAVGSLRQDERRDMLVYSSRLLSQKLAKGRNLPSTMSTTQHMVGPRSRVGVSSAGASRPPCGSGVTLPR
jgi:hypothetical protein